MHFVNYLPFGLLILVPGIILLYILKQKSEDKDISSLYLWRETYKNIEVSKPWEKLKNNLLMYLQIAVVLGLILALAGPYIASREGAADHVVLVFDNSGSMNALYAKGKSRLDTAKEQAVDYVEQLSTNTDVTVVSSNQTAKVALAGGKDKQKIKEVIYGLEGTHVAGDVNPAVTMTEAMAEQWESYETILFTDSSVDLGKLTADVVDLSNEGSNAAIDYVNYDYEQDGSLSVLAKVTNYGTNTISTDVNLYLNNKMTAIEKVSDLAPGKDTVIYFRNVTIPKGKKNTSTTIKAEINEKDDLNQDNTAYNVIREKEEQSVLLISKQNVFLEKALLTMDNIKVYKTSSLEEADQSKTYDLYIFDGVKPETIPDSNILFVNPKETGEYGELFTVDGKVKSGSFINLKSQDFTQLIDADFSFGVNQYMKVTPKSKAQVFLQSDDNTVGFVEKVKGKQIAVLAFDLHNSDFALQTEFPILMNQLFGKMLNSYLLTEAVITAGENYEVNQVSFVKETAGLYQVEGEMAAGKVEETLAVNFPSTDESKLTTKVNVNKDENTNNSKQKTTNTIQRKTRNIKTPVIFMVLLFLILEWIVYLRRR